MKTVEYEEEWKAKGYTNNKNLILFDPYLSAKAKIIYLQLKARDFNNKGYSFPGHKTIAKENNTSVSTVKRKIDELVEAGLLIKKQRGLTQTNRYDFLPLKNRYPQAVFENKKTGSSSVSEQKNSSADPLDSSSVSYKELEVQELQDKKFKVKASEASKQVKAAADIGNNSNTVNPQLSKNVCDLYKEIFNQELTVDKKKTLANEKQEVLIGVLELIKEERDVDGIHKPIPYIISLIEKYNNGEDVNLDNKKGTYKSEPEQEIKRENYDYNRRVEKFLNRTKRQTAK